MLRTVCIAILLLVTPSPTDSAERLNLATTTSVDNSGLLEMLIPPFEERFGMKVAVISVGTGKALKLAENGDVDVVIIHAPAAEEEFVKQGFGVNRRQFMFNHFLIAGPSQDPASVAAAEDAAQAFQRVARSSSPFISRGDDSGTHRRERMMWSEAGIEPEGRWYREVGQGMGASLLIADETSSYILTDQATFLAYRRKFNQLTELLQKGEELYNPYAIIAVNPARWPKADYFSAMALIAWVTSPEGQRLIEEYRVENEQVFRPLAVSSGGKPDGSR
ncbi:MAG: substrate-binding domain-containing protein [Candidatus Eisenbacteria sp.]|nr:substrate-binding domain-containing protein [Candidatus Eisenbacteria bacterium]